MEESTTYVALDAHKKQHTVAMLLPGEKEPQVWTVQNTTRDIRRMVRRVRKRGSGEVLFCYEAGVCGFALQRQIEAAGVDCEVIAPSLIPVKPGERIKTDRRDAKKLVQLLRGGLLTAVHVPDEEAEAVRDLVRCREAAQSDLQRSRQRLGKYLLRRGLIYREGRAWTQRHTRWLDGLKFTQPADTVVYAEYRMEVSRRQERVAALTVEVTAAAADRRYAKAVGWLRCFRGIDTVTAMTILVELHSFERFVTPRQLMSYLGLTPSESSSGESERKGGITKAGNRRVRRVLTEASWHQAKPARVSKALQQRRADQPAWVIALADRALKRLHRRHHRLVNRGKLPTVANTAVARELVGFLWAVLYLKGRAAPTAPAQETAEAPPPERRATAREFYASPAP